MYISRTYYTGTTVSFTTPIIYLPVRGAAGRTGVGIVRQFTFGQNEDFGSVPQTVIDFMARIPEISSQYPGIALCLPDGPSIIYQHTAFGNAPTTQGVAGDLTRSTVINVPGESFERSH
jgi:hypothetical protein